MQMRVFRLVALLCGISWPLAPSTCFAGMVTVLGDNGDGVAEENGLVDVRPFPTLRVGTGGDDERGNAAVFFFALPTVPSASSIVAADLRIAYTGQTPFSFPVTPFFNIDLYGMGARADATILSTDYFDGDPSQSTNTIIEVTAVTPSTSPSELQLDTTAFIQSLYQPNGSPLARFAVFRANPSVHIVPMSGILTGYELASADNATPSLLPELTVSTIPEPSSAILASLAGLFFLIYRAFKARPLFSYT